MGCAIDMTAAGARTVFTWPVSRERPDSGEKDKKTNGGNVLAFPDSHQFPAILTPFAFS